MGRLEQVHIKMGVYGTNRVGKTTLACTFPKPLLLVSFEGGETAGALSVRRVPGVDVVSIDGYADAVKLADELKTDTKYKTHVLDSVTSFQDIVLRDLLGLDTLPAQLGFSGVDGSVYVERAEKTKEGIRPFLSLPAHTVVIAKEKDHNPPKIERVNPKTGKIQPDLRPKFLRGVNETSFVTFELGGGTASWLRDKLEFIGRLYLDKEVILKKSKRTLNNVTTEVEETVETGRQVRRLLCQPTDNFEAGFKSDTIGSVPDTIEGPTEEEIAKGVTWYTKIAKVIGL